ncbi:MULTISPECIES: hypothetical protein [Pseudomonas]|jgi:hypothetical protein|uniref:hypothetical protein n=1 Tax=Pseudomonas TaxID=286 RepID=UPI0008761263|nr:MULTISPECIES: hypothetical protein [Pseudomonas]QIA05010.1 hypothetical protein GZH78_23560 [Pseudomonas fluorescens]SCZ20414.1 hypothetical protein SAMN03159313_0867 [Pseudomonas sp. NFIX46]SDB16925.1 hypothetical protein SAMN03097715_01298 [Pseudomonas putida]SFQ61410.1 hypothetical protein SAMN03159312_1009 [Pseudomonas sp. NFIX49]
MSERDIDTEYNFVKNGDMTQGYAHWVDVVNPGGVGIREDTWGDDIVSIMTLTHRAAVRQRMIVPIGQQEEARYSLRFLYENTYSSSPGLVVLNKRGSVEKFEIELPVKARVQDADPLAVDLTEMREDLPDSLGLQAGDELEINLSSPARGVGEPSSVEIRLTGIEVKLILPALALEAVINDGKRFVAGSVLPICLGATGDQRHRVSFEVDPQSVWKNLEASLWLEGNPQEAITAEPELGKAQPISLDWLLDCPEPSGKEPHELKAKIYSKYSAPPCTLLVSWGHHLLELLALKEAETYPVVEYNQSVELQVRVRSLYTQDPVASEVVWRVEGEAGKVLHRAPTDAQGRATYLYTPTEEGVSWVTASVASLLSDDGEATHTFEVRAFATDPFKTLQARFNGGTPAVWGAQTRYPERGERFLVNLDMPAEHPLSAARFFLIWAKGDSQADVGATAQPDFGAPAPVVDGTVLWTTTFEDKRDGQFDWALGCSRLQHLSPGNALSLAYNRVKIGGIWGPNKSPVVDEGDIVTCMVKVQRSDGLPIGNVEVEFNTQTGTVRSLTGVDGWASVDHQPIDSNDYSITARIQRHEDAPVEEHSFAVKPLLTNAWKGQVNVFLDGKPVDPLIQGVVCWRGRARKLRIDPVANSSFIGKPILLAWNGNTPPLPGLQLSPEAGVARVMSADGLEWDIIADPDKSGLSTLAFRSSHLQEEYEFPVRLLDNNLATEIQAMLDHVPAESGKDTLYPCLGATHQSILMPRGLSALHGLPVKSAITPLAPGMVVKPPLIDDVFMTAGGAERQLDFTSSAVGVEMTQTTTIVIDGESLTTRTQLKLGHNKLKILARRGPAVYPVMSKGERARIEVRLGSSFNDQPVEGAEIVMQIGSSEPVFLRTDTDGWARHDALPNQAGVSRVTAVVTNPYDGSTAQTSAELNALATDPWRDLLIAINDSEQHAWAGRSLFPRRGEEFGFRLLANDGSPLRDQMLALGLVKPGRSELGLEFNRPLGEFHPLSESGLEFRFKDGDVKDASVSFQLAASCLLERSSVQHLSLGNRAFVARITATSSVHEVVDWGAAVKAEVTVKHALTGKAMRGLPIRWELSEQESRVTSTNYWGVARISFVPEVAGAGFITATVAGGADSASVNFRYSMSEPCRIKELVVDSPSGHPGQSVSAHVLVVSALSEKALSGIEVRWQHGGQTLPSTFTDAQGKATIEFWRVPGETRLIASVQSGLVGSNVKSLMVSAPQDELVVAELTSEKTSFWLGDTMTAQALVHYEQHGGVAPGVPVVWHFPHLQSRTSMTNENGLAKVEVTAAHVGLHQLAAHVREGAAGSKTLGYEVLDPLDSPDHADIESVTASISPVLINTYTTMTALIVGTKSRQPMANRKIFVSRNGQASQEARTDSQGNFSHSWSPTSTSEQVSLWVTLENPGGSSVSKGVTVPVVER